MLHNYANQFYAQLVSLSGNELVNVMILVINSFIMLTLTGKALSKVRWSPRHLFSATRTVSNKGGLTAVFFGLPAIAWDLLPGMAVSVLKGFGIAPTPKTPERKVIESHSTILSKHNAELASIKNAINGKYKTKTKFAPSKAKSIIKPTAKKFKV